MLARLAEAPEEEGTELAGNEQVIKLLDSLEIALQ